jgi:hypothetical protein
LLHGRSGDRGLDLTRTFGACWVFEKIAVVSKHLIFVTEIVISVNTSSAAMINQCGTGISRDAIL